MKTKTKATTEHVILVDPQDKIIGHEEKIKAHQTGQLHRAFSVFIIKPAGMTFDVLLQRRNPDKYHCGNLWTNTCCGHPRPGETTITAGERRLFEEMGIHTTLTEIGCFQYKAEFNNGLTEHEIDHVLMAHHNDKPFTVNPLEVTGTKWMTIEALQKNINAHPNTFTPWLKPALSILLHIAGPSPLKNHFSLNQNQF